jgi:hemoglobin-like flavoprotein
MNHRQLELVRSSYERIRMVRPLFADLFHRRLFLVAPRLEPLFHADPAWRDAVFLDVVDTVVARLDRLDLLLPMLAAHARRWSRHGVLDTDYAHAGKALAWTVEQLLPAPAAIVAWRDTFEFLAAVMKRAVSDACAIPPAPPPRRTLVTLPYSDRPPPPRASAVPPSRGSGSLAPESRGSLTPA